MAPVLLVLVAFALMGGGTSKTPVAQQSPPQATQPQPEPGKSTGQIVADVVGIAADLFKKFMQGTK